MPPSDRTVVDRKAAFGRGDLRRRCALHHHRLARWLGQFTPPDASSRVTCGQCGLAIKVRRPTEGPRNTSFRCPPSDCLSAGTEISFGSHRVRCQPDGATSDEITAYTHCPVRTGGGHGPLSLSLSFSLSLFDGFLFVIIIAKKTLAAKMTKPVITTSYWSSMWKLCVCLVQFSRY